MRYHLLPALVCVSLLTGICEAAPAPTLALGFETPEATERAFGFTAELRSGRSGQALLTTGNHWLQPAVRAETMRSEAGTIMAWVQLVRKPAGGYLIRWLGSAEHVGITWSDNHPMVLAQSRQSAARPVEAGDWRHWAYVWEGATRRLYLDGELIIEAEHGRLEKPPGAMLRCEGEGNCWLLDDFMVFREALDADAIAALMGQAVAAAGELVAHPVEGPVPVVYDERQLIENPLLVQRRHTRPATAVPPGWRLLPGDNTATVSANGLHLRSDGDQPLSVLAIIRRGSVRPGAAYRLGLRYRLAGAGAAVRLRFRNQIDRGTREFILPDRPEPGREFVFATAPEDYDVGIYYLEILIEGNGAEMDILGAYCREAMATEVAGLDLAVREPALDLEPTVVPDTTWIEAIPADLELLPRADRLAAWIGGDHAVPGQLNWRLTKPGGSILLERDFRALFAELRQTEGRIRLAGIPADMSLPGGYGADPLPARSVHGVALLCGVGAISTGTNVWQHDQLLRSARDLLDDGRFIPFWSQKGVYEWKARWQAAGDNVADVPHLADLAAPPLFAHTAPGVLVSGYLDDDRLLLVMVNITNQRLGKLGDLYVDHRRLFGIAARDTGTMVKRGQITARDPERAAAASANWNRNGGGYINDYYFNIAIPPGDYRLMLIEVPE